MKQLHAAVMKSQQERFDAKMEVQKKYHTSYMETIEDQHDEKLMTMTKEHEEKLQRKCEGTDELKMSIEENETMDAVKAAADVFCHKQMEDAHEIQKVQEISEAKVAEMSKTKSGKGYMIFIAVGEKSLPEGVDGDSATAAVEGCEVSLNYRLQCKKPYEVSRFELRWTNNNICICICI